MYFKLSVRNVKRSFKDYFIYFLTLTFAVCIFYSFNSLEASEAMATLSSSQSEMLKSLMKLLSYVSIFVSVVLAFLILYANNFLVRRRKKELGLYMSLGMSKYRISQILVVETFFVGLMSLVAGLLLGIVVSQGLATLTVSMFDANITQFTFVFSSEAMQKTMLYFGLIFLFVMFFNSVVISRYKLINLLTAARKNEGLKIRKTSTSIILFIISLLILTTSYAMMMRYGLFENGNLVLFCVGLGSLGTFLFFMSLSGFLLNLIQKNKKIYFKDVNMFVLRQINSKVNTTFISMTIICLMLFFTIGVFSTGFSYKASTEKSVDQMAPYDVSLFMEISKASKIKNVMEAAEILNIDLNKYGEHHSFYRYQSDINPQDLLRPYQDAKTKNYFENPTKFKVNTIKKSDFEKIESMQGAKPITMNDQEVIVLLGFNSMKDVLNRYVKANKTIVINGEEYNIANQKVYNLSYITGYYAMDVMTVVVPDKAVKGMKPVSSIVNLNYKDHKEKYDEEWYQLLNKYTTPTAFDKYGFNFNGETKTMLQDASVGSSTMIVFIGIYLGIVFLISSAAVLALQQLSEASDNLDRYNVLKKIGVTKKNINKAIFWQIFIYFMMPLALAIVHSIIGIQLVNNALIVIGESSVLIPSLITALILIFVYGGYFLATYAGYKSIVK